MLEDIKDKSRSSDDFYFGGVFIKLFYKLFAL